MILRTISFLKSYTQSSLGQIKTMKRAKKQTHSRCDLTLQLDYTLSGERYRNVRFIRWANPPSLPIDQTKGNEWRITAKKKKPIYTLKLNET